jgi:AhpD family alkylhydroperoxidase
MPRLRLIEEQEKTPESRALIESASRTGAPDYRVVSIMTRDPVVGTGWVKYWNTVLYEGRLPHKLKEMCRIKISVAHHCGYCSTVRSNVAREEGLTEEMVADLFNFAASDKFTPREKAALRYAEIFKADKADTNWDAVYAELKKHFVDEEIIELGQLCAQTDGVGKLVKTLNIVSWEEACELKPMLKDAEHA